MNVGPCGAIFVVCRSVAHGKEIVSSCAEVRAHGEAFFRRVLYFNRVFCIWPTTKALFVVCPMICAWQTLRHTTNYRFLVTPSPPPTSAASPSSQVRDVLLCCVLLHHRFTPRGKMMTGRSFGYAAAAAVTSIVWMLLRWNSHAPRAAAKRA